MKTERGIKDMYQDHFIEKIFDFMKKLRGSQEARQKKIDDMVSKLPKDEKLTSPIWRIQNGKPPFSDRLTMY
jgi:hypothetical protein